MHKVISFSLWGDNPKYTVGAIKNSELAPFIYTGWESRFYVSDCVPQDIINQLEANGSTVVKKGAAAPISAFWRFDPICDESVDIFIARDTDSRLNYRERIAVDAWISSPYKMHIMRDHSWHASQILGGMWGLKDTIDVNIFYKAIEDFLETHYKNQELEIGKYGLNQHFLREYIIPMYQHTAMEHDEFFAKRPFPTPRENNEYVGAPFDENNKLEIGFK
jgi:protein O-GlcNAc transferase